jgi:hypothetical protein
VIVSVAAAFVVGVAVCFLLVRSRGVLPTARRLRGASAPKRARRIRALARRVRARIAHPRRRGRSREDEPARSNEHEELARVLRQATRTAGDVHHLLRPALADIARGRLASRGVDFDAEPSRVRSLLGDELADLLEADRPLPPDFFGAGIPLNAIEAHVARLEAL